MTIDPVFLYFIGQLPEKVDLVLPDFVFGEFVPCATYHPALDFLLYLEKDTSYTSQYINGTNIELLWDNHPDAGGKLVGVKINGFSCVAPPEVIAAYKVAYGSSGSKGRDKSDDESDGMCIECGQFMADPPSKLCPGCEAYQDHTK